MLELIISVTFEAASEAHVLHAKIMPIDSFKNGKNLCRCTGKVRPLNNKCTVHMSMSLTTSTHSFRDDTDIE